MWANPIEDTRLAQLPAYVFNKIYATQY